jgi:hypothetical protein
VNHKHIARVYLGWFEQEAYDLSVSDSVGGSSLVWSDDGSFVIGYRRADGFRCYQRFVGDLATSRLGHADADRVLSAAVALVGAQD